MRKHDEPQTPVRETLTPEDRKLAYENLEAAFMAYETGGREAMHRKLEELIGKAFRARTSPEAASMEPDQ
ncbi:MAG TPA: hypothetical protein VKU00_17910 [Chthonomonadaceae bacterium]|nr:hypothetical protein [Chthonomonadaceae bacterium]